MDNEILSDTSSSKAVGGQPAGQSTWWQWLLERTVAVVFSLALLLTLFPVLYIVMAAYIKFRTPGPAIVLRSRRRADGHCYQSYTFRLADGESLLARMPQLINLLRGDVLVHICVRVDSGQPLPEVAENKGSIGRPSDPPGFEPQPVRDGAETCTALSPDLSGTESEAPETAPEPSDEGSEPTDQETINE